MILLERILRQNPWWQGKEIKEIKNYKERFLLKEIEKYFNNPQIIAILGLRRTGKSVLLAQIIKRFLLKSQPKRILYFSFDEILGKDPEILEKILEIYENEILKEDLENVCIFFDEINHLKDWQIILKRFYDLKRKIKFFISGSSSIYLKKSKESLAGRIYEFNLYPLNFKEYLYLKGVDVKNVALQALVLKKELNRYFLSGSLPEIIQEVDFSKIKKYINSLIDKIAFYDIPKVYEINEPEVLKMIISFIAQRPGMTLDYQNLASSLKVSYQTISKYVGYLEKAFLIKLLYNFRGSPIARARKLKKAYLGSINLASGFLDSEQELLGNLSLLAENLVCLHLDAKWFWKKYTEIDFYHKDIPVEVKYTETKPDIKNSFLAAKHLRAKRITIVTKDTEKEEERNGIKIVYLPLWKFLLFDGQK
ncbi:MAG: ATP-binding protein [Candidatus Ratteibacteria bacterium]|nr:ATP-binding protein [Candidatus Ratteibacteria bacterium]